MEFQDSAFERSCNRIFFLNGVKGYCLIYDHVLYCGQSKTQRRRAGLLIRPVFVHFGVKSPYLRNMTFSLRFFLEEDSGGYALVEPFRSASERKDPMAYGQPQRNGKLDPSKLSSMMGEPQKGRRPAPEPVEPDEDERKERQSIITGTILSAAVVVAVIVAFIILAQSGQL